MKWIVFQTTFNIFQKVLMFSQNLWFSNSTKILNFAFYSIFMKSENSNWADTKNFPTNFKQDRLFNAWIIFFLQGWGGWSPSPLGSYWPVYAFIKIKSAFVKDWIRYWVSANRIIILKKQNLYCRKKI